MSSEIHEFLSYSGRLFYSQEPVAPQIPRYFNPRPSRPHILRICRNASADSVLVRAADTSSPSVAQQKKNKRKSAGTSGFCKKVTNFKTSFGRVFGCDTSSQGPTKLKKTQKKHKRKKEKDKGKAGPKKNRLFTHRRSRAVSVPHGVPEIAVRESENEEPSGTREEEGLSHGDSERDERQQPATVSMHRNQLGEDTRTASTSSVLSTPAHPNGIGALLNEKPIATGNGLSISISLAEPMLFLQGFDAHDAEERNTSMLRGSLHLRVSKSAKIKSIYLKFKGRAETEWPEGIPPKKIEFKSSESLINHTWPFFNAAFPGSGHGADSVLPLKGPVATTREVSPGVTGVSADKSRDGISPKDLRRLSLQQVQSRSFGKGDNIDPTVSAKGYRLFTPGDYIYNFELPIDSRLPESINVELGNVKYELEAIVERSGAFRANLVGSKEVTLIRAPSESSLEAVEPIAISRDWEDQLHYDIVISGKSFPLGAQVPIAFKLTPLAKVQCHRIKIYVTENIQYFTASKRVHRLEPTRRIQLFEKRADGPSTSTFPGSTLKISAGGGVAYDSRQAAAEGDENVERDTTNLLGNLSGEHNVGPTEMEVNVQLPSCQAMAHKEHAAKLHFDTTYSNIQVHHWIKIVLRLSRPDAEDPNKRRHFEISIDSPFNILSCRATQANICLPAYTSPESVSMLTDHTVCGCPDAPRRRNRLPHPHLARSVPSSSSEESNASSPMNIPAPPPAAHVHDNVARGALQRPVHLLRAPSFNPPAFSDEDPPPPLVTPPPKYESLVQADPRTGLEDYFARLADELGGDENDDAVSLGARVDLPLTPGGRVNRSMDERRSWLPVGYGA